jgi:hypothetical protein
MISPVLEVLMVVTTEICNIFTVASSYAELDYQDLILRPSSLKSSILGHELNQVSCYVI